MQAKYTNIVKALESRVRGGDYALSGLPGERRIAEEFGVSHMTARRAVRDLLQRGVLTRPSRRLSVGHSGRTSKRNLCICCVLPAFDDTDQQTYRILSALVGAREGIARAAMYVHEEDPIIHQALLGDFTGVFIVPPHRPSQLLLDHMARNRHKVVTLWHNHTSLGIPCVENGPTSSVHKLVEHLASLGHKRIDCLNTQPDNQPVRARIVAWRETIARLGLGGDLFDLPVEPFGDSRIAARDHMRRLVQSRRLTSTAMFCVTTGAAIGACRALYELNIAVGKEYSVCGFGEMSHAQLHTPSLTVVEPNDLVPYLKMGLEWILSGRKATFESLSFQPSEADLWIGESTGPVLPSAL